VDGLQLLLDAKCLMASIGRCLAIVSFLVEIPAHAHDADVVFVRAQRSGQNQVVEHVTLTFGTLGLLVRAKGLEENRQAIESAMWNRMPLSADNKPCIRGATKALVHEGYAELIASFSCSFGTLTQTFGFLESLPRAYRVVVESDGSATQQFAEFKSQSVTLWGSGSRSKSQPITGVLGWIWLGIFHIFSGLDHLAFLVALLLIGKTWRQVLLMITSFTVAHSITLGATTLDLIVLNAREQRWAEAAIALSVAYVALGNLLFKEHKHRALVTFAFGLIHGFGFAAALKEYGLGQSVGAGLFGFNLGVELGQACVVGLLYPAIRLLQRRPRINRAVVSAASLLIFAAAGYWFVDRIA